MLERHAHTLPFPSHVHIEKSEVPFEETNANTNHNRKTTTKAPQSNKNAQHYLELAPVYFAEPSLCLGDGGVCRNYRGGAGVPQRLVLDLPRRQSSS